MALDVEAPSPGLVPLAPADWSPRASRHLPRPGLSVDPDCRAVGASPGSFFVLLPSQADQQQPRLECLAGCALPSLGSAEPSLGEAGGAHVPKEVLGDGMRLGPTKGSMIWGAPAALIRTGSLSPESFTLSTLQAPCAQLA